MLVFSRCWVVNESHLLRLSLQLLPIDEIILRTPNDGGELTILLVMHGGFRGCGSFNVFKHAFLSYSKCTTA